MTTKRIILSCLLGCALGVAYMLAVCLIIN